MAATPRVEPIGGSPVVPTLPAGAVDVAVETGDTELLEAVAARYDRTLAHRTHLTGGMGSRHAGETFGEDFVLPAERAYSETCAGVASIMLAWRLLLATGETRYVDIIQRTLYNVVATSIGDDGRSFFYANTLHQRERGEPVPVGRERLHFAAGIRAPWFDVSCCLGNMARLLASLCAYVATVDGDSVRPHQYANAVVRTQLGDGRRAALRVRTDYPETGTVTVRVTEPPGGPWALALRAPAWASGARLDGEVVEPGVAVVWREFGAGEEVRLELPVRPRWTFPDPRIDAARGCVAVERGPVVLCAESVGLDNLDDLTVEVTTSPEGAEGGATVRGTVHDTGCQQLAVLARRAGPRSSRSSAGPPGALSPVGPARPIHHARLAPRRVRRIRR